MMLKLLTRSMDKFFVAGGVAETELLAIKGRSAMYLSMVAMAGTAVVLSTSIILNVTNVV